MKGGDYSPPFIRCKFGPFSLEPTSATRATDSLLFDLKSSMLIRNRQ
jgi:hypothetical protein